ncbi:aldo/keto reductase [Streptomyces candidus]|uniref:aldo/keto reductase n=1 Tax=Streptomyces candidus TaxID=67283 RepID=UPI0016117DD3|nr:aldo/keto reductase [Streptomyces candidus]
MKSTRVGLGGAGWDGCDDQQVIATIRHAVDKGINWIDTAAVYGRGRAQPHTLRCLVERPPARPHPRQPPCPTRPHPRHVTELGSEIGRRR